MTLQIAVGDVFAGKYRIESRLGSGGMGEVVAARHIELGQQVAIKILRKEVAQNAEAMARFMREGQAAARLRSTHTARILDVGRLDSGMLYLVMEYLDGQDLSQVIEERGALSLQEAVDFILQACEAVADAHSLGIVHRDLKPANLFLTLDPFGQPQIKVLDFGISKWAPTAVDPATTPGSMTLTSVVMGSPLYMPPEQMRSARDADERSDVWALGTILWELLTARHIWEAETMSAICMRVASEPTPSLSAIRPDLPIALDTVLATCLQKEPIHRFQSVVDLACALVPFGGAAALSTLGRIKHFAGIRAETAPSALGSINVQPSTNWDSVSVAQTPPSPRQRGSGQNRSNYTITPDTWLSGTDPHSETSQRGSIAVRVAAIGGLLAAALILASWWLFQRSETRVEASFATPGFLVATNPASTGSAAPAAQTSATLAPSSAPTEDPDVQLAPTRSPSTNASLLPMQNKHRPNGAATTNTKPLPVASIRERVGTRADEGNLEQVSTAPKGSIAPLPTAISSGMPDWGGRL